MFELLVFFSTGFWVFAFIMFAILVACVENEKGWGTAIVFAVTVFLLYFFGMSPAGGNNVSIRNAIAWCWDNKLLAILGVIANFGAGLLWAMARTHIFAVEKREKFEEEKAEYIKDYGLAKWQDKLKNSTTPDFDNVARYERSMAKRITMWIIWWIPSLAWFIVRHPVRRIAKWLYRRFQGTFRWIYTSAMAKVIEEHQLAKATTTNTQPR